MTEAEVAAAKAVAENDAAWRSMHHGTMDTLREALGLPWQATVTDMVERIAELRETVIKKTEPSSIKTTGLRPPQPVPPGKGCRNCGAYTTTVYCSGACARANGEA